MSVVFAKIQMRRGTAAQWAAANPVLAQGELAFETDTGLTKVGDGATAYASLPAYATYDQMLAAKEALDEAALDVAAVEASRTAAAASAATASTKATEAAASAASAVASEQSILAKVNQAEQARIDAIAYAAVAEEKADEIVASANAAAADASAADADRIAAEAARTGAEAAQAAAQGAAAGALASEVAADASADVASGAAASALAIYGSVDAQNTAVATAQAQASLAAGFAASAASVVQQDLSGVTAQALHRSPNAVTAMFIYDTSKDSDGGAWTEKCQHTSWWNEAINGKWLGPQASETAARAVSGATTGDYFQRTSDGRFYSLNAGSGITEVFRGNKRDFPRLAGIVAEGEAVTIYDLTEPGRPMWMTFRSGGGALPSIWRTSRLALSSAMLNGILCIGLSGSDSGYTGLYVAEFVSDNVYRRNTSGIMGASLNIARRNDQSVQVSVIAPATIANGTVNAVAMTVLPDAPMDPVTGLRVPTIAVATEGGLSFIRHDGTVATITDSFYGRYIEVVFERRGSIVARHSSSAPFFTRLTRYFRVPQSNLAITAGAVGANGYSIDVSLMRMLGSGGSYKLLPNLLRAEGNVSLYREDVANGVRSLVATMSPSFNTGWMAGDIRRCFLSDTEVGSVTGPELVTNGGFNTDLSGWDISASTAPSTVVWSGGQAVFQTDGTNSARLRQSFSLVVGKTYRFTHGAGAPSAFLGTAVGGNQYGTVSGGSSLVFTATSSTFWISYTTAVNGTVVDNVSVREVVADRSYKAQAANITGTLTRAQLASGTSLVGYSGFSAANYLREPYSADLDFGTGEWTGSAWVSMSNTPRRNRVTFSEQFDNAAWTKTGGSITANAAAAPDGTTTADQLVENAGAINGALVSQAIGTWLSGFPAGISIHAKEVAGSAKRYLVFGVGNADTRWAYVVVDLATGTVTATSVDGVQSGIVAGSVSVQPAGDGYYRVSFVVTSPLSPGFYTLRAGVTNTPTPTFTSSAIPSYTGDGASGILLWGAYGEPGSVVNAYQRVVDGTETFSGAIFDRAHSSGPTITLRFVNYGQLQATASDGTTTRTVTTTSTYPVGQWLKARVNYTTDGTLAILVNGREVAATRGAPLLTLNNASAVLTIGNSFALDAPFPGSIALLKLGATVPTPEQATFMFEQEKQLFRAGALSVLPDSGAIVDMAYDDATDRWVAISAANESYWTGLVRNSVQAVPAGSFSRVVAGSGLELAARTGTNPGVDVTIPAYGLREELVRRAEAAARLSRELVAFDFVGGFTANTTNGSAAITNVAGLTYPGSMIGARVSGAGIPANTRIVGVSGTTIYLSAVATATATGVSISFLDFNLPVAFEARAVLSAGALRREGSTADFTRLYDGFLETIRFAVAPGATAWVQIQATRGTMQ